MIEVWAFTAIDLNRIANGEKDKIKGNDTLHVTVSNGKAVAVQRDGEVLDGYYACQGDHNATLADRAEAKRVIKRRGTVCITQTHSFPVIAWLEVETNKSSDFIRFTENRDY